MTSICMQHCPSREAVAGATIFSSAMAGAGALGAWAFSANPIAGAVQGAITGLMSIVALRITNAVFGKNKEAGFMANLAGITASAAIGAASMYAMGFYASASAAFMPALGLTILTQVAFSVLHECCS